MTRVVTGLKWVLVTGAGVGLHDAERAAARRLGALLGREGYGLIAGTWGGVDEEVTRSFVNAIPVDSCAERIIHIENSDDRSFHQIRMGRIIKSSPEVAYA